MEKVSPKGINTLLKRFSLFLTSQEGFEPQTFPGECLVSCLIITMSPLTTSTLCLLCLLVYLVVRPWESCLVLATCCLVLCWDRGRLDSLGNMETHPYLLVIIIPCRGRDILTESKSAPPEL